MVKDGTFPDPVDVTPGRRAFVKDEVIAWAKNKILERDLAFEREVANRPVADSDMLDEQAAAKFLTAMLQRPVPLGMLEEMAKNRTAPPSRIVNGERKYAEAVLVLWGLRLSKVLKPE